ncbi:MAG: ABC transporter permease [Acidobacteria bacterium]|nr:ABC transporter permease [Acidobacteriota bacterium]
MQELIWANLKARPVRTTLSVAAVALQVFLLLFLMGLTTGIVEEWNERVRGIGADLLIQPPNASPFLAFSSAVLPERQAAQLARLDGVQVVSPVVAVVNTEGISLIYGIDFDSYNALGSGFLFHAGGPFQQPFDVIIDDVKAHSLNFKVGDTLRLLNTDFRIVGIAEHGRGARYFIPLKTAQELLGVENRVSMFWVQTNGQIEPVRQRVVRLLPRHQVRPMEEYLSLMVSSNLPEVRPFTRAVILVGLVITFLVILLSMYTVVLERTHEIGILKALGASRWNVAALLLRESVVIAFLGLGVGIGSTYVVKAIVTSLRPTLNIVITPEWLLQALALALVGCLIGSVYPAVRAASADPVAALAYE